MKNIAQHFENIYLPRKALILYQSEKENVYVESYDMDKSGRPVNAHPLSIDESITLASLLDCSDELKKDFLKSKGLLPEKILYICPGHYGFAIWYTPPQKVKLFFKPNLSIPNGKGKVPAMIWKANKDSLQVYAIKEKGKPNERTELYHAPFFNIHEDGAVCMGTVDIDVDNKCMLENFIQLWEDYFWNSYFSHLLQDRSPVKANIVQLWQQQVSSNREFPTDILIENGLTLKDLLI